MSVFKNLKFRCSSLGHLMTDPKSKADKEAGKLSEGTKTHLVDIFVSNRYNRNTEIHSKYIIKGNLCEEDSITLYSRLTGNFFKKNEERLSNTYIQGTPDLFIGKSIFEAETIIDIKTSWDIFTFYRVLSKPISDLYYWQLQGYMQLTGAKEAKIAYCLVDTPEVMINDEKRRLFYKMGVPTEENPVFIEACEEIDRAMRFGDIPKEERVIEFTFKRDDEGVNKLYEKIKKARVHLEELEEKICNKSLLTA